MKLSSANSFVRLRPFALKKMLQDGLIAITRAHLCFTQLVSTEVLGAVTHVNGTARIQTVTSVTNSHLYELLMAFKARTGYGVLCNTSLNFKGRGFINDIADLSTYTIEHNLDGFVIEGRSYMLKSSKNYQSYLRVSDAGAGRMGG
jgi:predicted NodU family carbamoyl transferase